MKQYLKILCFGIILEFLFLQGKTNNSFFFFLGFLFLVFSIFFLKKQEIIFLLIFLIPNQRLLTFQENGVSILNGLFIYLFIKLLLEKVNIKKFILPALILITYGLIIASVNSTYSEFLIIIKLLITSFVCYFLISKNKSIDLYRLIMYFVLGSLTVGFLSFFNSSLQIGGATRFDGGVGNEPNYAGTLFSLSLALFLFIDNRLNFNKIIKILIPTSLMFFGILTMSRSFILSAIIVILVYSLYKLKENLIYTLLFIMSFLFLFFEKITNFYNNSPLFQILTDRIINPRNDDVSGGRLGFWSDYWDIITSTYKNLFLGVGFSAMNNFNLDQVAHNFFLEDMLTFGLIGVLLLYSYLFYFFNYFKREKITINILLPLFIFLLNSFTLHSFLGMGGVVTFFICLIPFYIVKNQ